MKRNLLTLFLVILAFLAKAQTNSIVGAIVDNETSEALPGANVVVKGTSVGATTDMDGKFQLNNLRPGSYSLEVSYIGYANKALMATVKPGQTTDLGSIALAAASVGLQEVQVIASVAIDRKTPVAFSAVSGQKIESRIGNQEFPEILRSTPSIYVTKVGGGFGDSRINVRGFDQSNTAVMINGIPINDMENGLVYWSNWAGLTDVTSSIQVQRGLGASKLAVASVGGSINIVTNAAQVKKGAAASVSFGNDGYSKYGFSYNTGLSDKGWAFSMQGTHTRGDGYADGTLFRAYSYFASVAKVFNPAHSLNLTILGAPQWHFQREYGSYDGVTIQTVQERGTRYNPQWGYYGNSEYKDNIFSWRKNFYHKPIAFLNHYWTISNKTELATSVYASFGRGGGTGDLGQINGRYRTSGRFKSQADGTVRWNDISNWNTGGSVPDFGAGQVPWQGPGETNNPGYSGPFAGQHVAESYRNGMILRGSMNDHNWYGILSNLTHQLSDNLNLVAGIDGRIYKGIHYRRLENLLGLDAYFDDNNINNPERYVTNEKSTADADKIDYYDDGLVNWLGLFGQLEYTKNDLSAFASLSGSNQGFRRVDYFLYKNDDNTTSDGTPKQKSDWVNILGGTVKAGINYNISGHSNVFVNGGYFSRQPIFDDVFINNTNNINDDRKNQHITSVEVGYGFRSGILSANINLYNTLWANRQISRDTKITVDTLVLDGTALFKNISELHQGVELDFTLKPSRKLSFTGMLSIGNWKYTNDFIATSTPDDPQYAGDAQTLTLYMKDVKVGNAAQTTLNLSMDYEIVHGLKLYLSYYNADNLYADFNIATDKAFLTSGNQAWKLPNYSLFDGGLYYKLTLFDTDMDLSLNVNNLFDKTYLSESTTNILYDPDNATDQQMGQIGDNGSYRNIAYYGFGRTWNAGLKIRF